MTASLLALTLLQSVTALPAAPAAEPPMRTSQPATAPLAGQLPPAMIAERFNQCHDTATDDPAAGIGAANDWLIDGGGSFARQCLGFAYAKGGQYAAAASAFAQGATEAENNRDTRAANLWAQAGNAALAGGDAATARAHLNAALAQGQLKGQAEGLVYLDRARAAAATSDWDAVKSDLFSAQRLVPEDPLVWLLSATMARRGGDLVRAQADLDTAAKLAPGDAAIALEAGAIAVLSGNDDAARKSWASAIAIAPGSAEAKAAADYIAQLDAVPTP